MTLTMDSLRRRMGLLSASLNRRPRQICDRNRLTQNMHPHGSAFCPLIRQPPGLDSLLSHRRSSPIGLPAT